MRSDIDGIYWARMSGSDDHGFAMFVFFHGVVSGVDPLGVQFDGAYSLTSDCTNYEAKVTVTVPPNSNVIQGVTSGPSGMTYDVLLVIAADFAERDFIRIETPLGPVNAKFHKLRSLPGKA